MTTKKVLPPWMLREPTKDELSQYLKERATAKVKADQAVRDAEGFLNKMTGTQQRYEYESRN